MVGETLTGDAMASRNTAPRPFSSIAAAILDLGCEGGRAVDLLQIGEGNDWGAGTSRGQPHRCFLAFVSFGLRGALWVCWGEIPCCFPPFPCGMNCCVALDQYSAVLVLWFAWGWLVCCLRWVGVVSPAVLSFLPFHSGLLPALLASICIV